MTLPLELRAGKQQTERPQPTYNYSKKPIDPQTTEPTYAEPNPLSTKHTAGGTCPPLKKRPPAGKCHKN